MPTGYTDSIKNGISFEQFAMNCARAFGALVTMRDEPSGAVIPEEFVPSDYHAKSVAETEAELARLLTMSPEEMERAAAKLFDDSETQRSVYLAERADLRGKYEAMLSKVNAWHPPTLDHVEMQEFMRDQITRSIDFDCGGKWMQEPTKRKSVATWHAEAIEGLQKNLAYHREENAKEIERAARRTSWVNALRRSLS